MSEIIYALQTSDDPVARRVAEAQIAKQDGRRKLGKNVSWGRSPSTIKHKGVDHEVETTVKKGSDGFKLVPPEKSYEAIVRDYPERFSERAFETASARLLKEIETYAPVADPNELDRKVRELLDRSSIAKPQGSTHPDRTESTCSVFLRDPKVKAWVLREAKGVCEACSTPAPFRSKGSGFLEVHHVKQLADGGPDTINNAVAVCPNCHRGFHFSDDADELVSQLFKKVTRLVRH